MKQVDTTGKTVEEALQAALKALQANREEVKIEILEEPSKGIFGIRNKSARVRVTLEEDPAVLAKALLDNVFRAMKLEVVTEVQVSEEHIYLTFHGPDLGIIIGRRGETLDALQYIVNLAVNRKIDKKVKMILDVEDYRKKREQTLTRLAQRLSDKVKRTGHNVVLEPMNPHERRVIHMALQNDSKVNTFSEGDEPFRKVVISLKQEMKAK